MVACDQFAFFSPFRQQCGLAALQRLNQLCVVRDQVPQEASRADILLQSLQGAGERQVLEGCDPLGRGGQAQAVDVEAE